MELLCCVTQTIMTTAAVLQKLYIPAVPTPYFFLDLPPELTVFFSSFST